MCKFRSNIRDGMQSEVLAAKDISCSPGFETKAKRPKSVFFPLCKLRSSPETNFFPSQAMEHTNDPPDSFVNKLFICYTWLNKLFFITFC